MYQVTMPSDYSPTSDKIVNILMQNQRIIHPQRLREIAKRRDNISQAIYRVV